MNYLRRKKLELAIIGFLVLMFFGVLDSRGQVNTGVMTKGTQDVSGVKFFTNGNLRVNAQTNEPLAAVPYVQLTSAVSSVSGGVGTNDPVFLAAITGAVDSASITWTHNSRTVSGEVSWASNPSNAVFVTSSITNGLTTLAAVTNLTITLYDPIGSAAAATNGMASLTDLAGATNNIALPDLTDVTLGSLSNGEALTYDSVSGNWTNLVTLSLATVTNLTDTLYYPLTTNPSNYLSTVSITLTNATLDAGVVTGSGSVWGIGTNQVVGGSGTTNIWQHFGVNFDTNDVFNFESTIGVTQTVSQVLGVPTITTKLNVTNDFATAAAITVPTGVTLTTVTNLTDTLYYPLSSNPSNYLSTVDWAANPSNAVFVTSSVTNGLASLTTLAGATNGLVTASVTNGLVTATVTNGLATTAYVDGSTNNLALPDMTDVTLGTLSNLDILTYNNASGNWTNLPASAGSETDPFFVAFTNAFPNIDTDATDDIAATITNGLATIAYVDGATNQGWVTSSVTNGLSTIAYVDGATNQGWVTSTVTNGLATIAYVDGATNNLISSITLTNTANAAGVVNGSGATWGVGTNTSTFLTAETDPVFVAAEPNILTNLVAGSSIAITGSGKIRTITPSGVTTNIGTGGGLEQSFTNGVLQSFSYTPVLYSGGNTGLFTDASVSAMTGIPHIIVEASYGTNDLANAVPIGTGWTSITNGWLLTSGSMPGFEISSNGITYTNAANAMAHTATTLSYKGDNASARDYYFAMANIRGGATNVMERGRIVDSATSANIESTALHTFFMLETGDRIILMSKSPTASAVTVITFNFVSMSLK